MTVNGITYTLGKSSNLTSDGNNWTLTIPAATFDPGTYEVIAESTGRGGTTIDDTTSNELVIAKDENGTSATASDDLASTGSPIAIGIIGSIVAIISGAALTRRLTARTLYK